jgi:hypothetical protein
MIQFKEHIKFKDFIAISLNFLKEYHIYFNDFGKSFTFNRFNEILSLLPDLSPIENEITSNCFLKINKKEYLDKLKTDLENLNFQIDNITLETKRQRHPDDLNIIIRLLKKSCIDYIELVNIHYSINNAEVKTKRELTLPEIALIYIYNKTVIDRKNAIQIANNYEYIANNSGEKLYQYYCKFLKRGNRIALDNLKKAEYKAKRIEKIINYIEDPKNRKEATDELSILKAAISKYS